MIEMIGGPDRDRTDDLFHAIFRRPRNLLILKASVAPEGPQMTSRNRLLLPYCSQKSLLLPRDKSFVFSIFSTLKTDPLNGSGRRLRSFEWRFGPPFSEVRSSYLPRLHRLSHEPRLCRCAERKPRNGNA
jgi:hypothetical protein